MPRFFNKPEDLVQVKALVTQWKDGQFNATDVKTAIFAPTHSHYAGVQLFQECAKDPKITKEIKLKFLDMADRVTTDYRDLCHRVPGNPDKFCAPDQMEKDYGHDEQWMQAINRTLLQDHWKNLRPIHKYNFEQLYPEITEWPE